MNRCGISHDRLAKQCISGIAFSVLLTGCGPGIVLNDDDVGLTLLTPEEVDSHLKDTRDTFEDNAVSPGQYSSEMEDQIAKLCGVEGPGTGGFSALKSAILGVAGTFIDSTISFIFDQISNSLEEVLQRYTSAYKGEQTDFFYAGRVDGEDKKRITQKFTCIRLKRDVEAKNPKTNEMEIKTLDLIAQIRMVNSYPRRYEGNARAVFDSKYVSRYKENRGKNLAEDVNAKRRELAKWSGKIDELEYLAVTPLRLAVNGMAAESDKKSGSDKREFTVNVGLKVESTWVQGTQGRQEIVEKPILSADFEFEDGGQVVQYYFESREFKGKSDDLYPEGATTVIFPIVPYSPDYLERGKTDGSGKVNIEISVAEVGVPSDELKAAIAIFGKSSADLAGLMSDALKKKWKIDNPE